MLESATPEIIDGLRTREGMSSGAVNLKVLQRGDLLRVHTESDNVYLLELTCPVPCCAHVYRCEGRLSAPHAGYLGARSIEPSLLQPGKQLFHSASRTSPITKIILLGNVSNP